MKIYTKAGDEGTTGLIGGEKVSKSHSRILAYGSVDEINSSIGIVLTQNVGDDVRVILTKIQNDLFTLGSDLANPDMTKSLHRVTNEMVEFLEKKIDQFENELDPITNFIIPGGDMTASHVHMSRAISRRAETAIVSLSEKEQINKICQIYINRLSDLLFVLARIINKRKNVKDIFWEK